MADSRRIEWIDYKKAFSTLAVVLYHTNITPSVKSIAYLVCLPAFFMAAGLFTNTSLSPSAFFRRKTLRLLIPYLVFGVLSWIAWLFIGRNFGEDTDASAWWSPLAGMLIGDVDALEQNRPLWFLCCMMMVEWIYYPVGRIAKKWMRRACVLFAAVVGCILAWFGIKGIWEMTAALIILPLYAVSAEQGVSLINRITALKTKTLLLIMAGSVAGVTLGYLFNADISISRCRLGNPFMFYLTAFSVAGMWMSLAVLLERFAGKLRLLCYLGQNTLIILCTHIPLFGAIKGVAMIAGIPLDFFQSSAGSLCLWVTAILVEIPVIWIINTYFPFLIGKKRKSPNP